jgi:hypothetical protein
MIKNHIGAGARVPPAVPIILERLAIDQPAEP